MAELADLLEVHVRTVQAWHKSGMRPIDPHDRPRLFMGYEIKQFLENRRKKRKCKLNDGEFFCPRCRAARTSLPNMLKIEQTNRKIGKDDYQVLIKGKCIECDCRLFLFATEKCLITSIFYQILAQADKRLNGYSQTTVINDFKGGNNDKAKLEK